MLRVGITSDLPDGVLAPPGTDRNGAPGGLDATDGRGKTQFHHATPILQEPVYSFFTARPVEEAGIILDLRREAIQAMSIQELGSIGEFIAAIATVITLIYLAFQLRQNTRALKAAAFQNVTSEMGKNVEHIMDNGELAEILIKGTVAPQSLTPAERLRLSAVYVSSFRRLESVYVQYSLGTMEHENKKGFEQSMLPLLQLPFGREWWNEAKTTFYEPFVRHVDARIASGEHGQTMPSMLLPESADKDA